MMKSLIFLFLSGILVVECRLPYEGMENHAKQYELPDLPYEYNELEPFIDEDTVKVHYEGHHGMYTDRLNMVLGIWRGQTKNMLSLGSIIAMLQNLNVIEEAYRESIKIFGGGFFNHNLYWSVMTPNPKDETREPARGKFLTLINKEFESFTEFKRQFSVKANSLFGSGYVWLSFRTHQNGTDSLEITKTANQDCPLSNDLYPILCIDVWEHAYYLKYQNKRVDHVKNWWKLVDWKKVEGLMKWWKKSMAIKNMPHEEL